MQGELVQNMNVHVHRTPFWDQQQMLASDFLWQLLHELIKGNFIADSCCFKLSGIKKLVFVYI